MKAGVLQWGLAALASIVAHLMLAAALALTVAPGAIPPEPPPEPRFELSAQPVEQVTAQPQPTDGTAVPEARAEASILPPGTVPTGRAAPVAAVGTALSASDAPISVLAGVAPTGQAVTVVPLAGVSVLPDARPATTDAPRLAAISPGGATVPATSPGAMPATSVPAVSDRLGSAVAPADALGSSVPTTEALASSQTAAPVLTGVAPEAQIAAPSAPPSQPVSTAAAPAQALPAGQPDAPSLAAGPVPVGDSVTSAPPGDLAQAAATVSAAGTRAQAAQAWSGSDGAQIDPVSLAAIQSFMQPADLDRLGADPVRDGIAGLLASVPCARMQTVFLPETGTLELRGHVPDEGLRDPVLAALAGQVGGAIPVADNLRVLPRPQCDVLTGIADLGLPQSTVQDTDPRLVGPDAHAREYAYVDGETLTFQVTTPDYPAHVYIDYFDAEGMVLHLQPNEMLDTVLMDPKSTLTVGFDASGAEVFTITVAPPFGNEIAVAFAASTPIHDAPRPVREPAAPYLDWLRDRIAAARAADPDFKGEWVYFFMSTAPRTQ